MYIDTVKLTNFKRFESLELHLDEKINVFIGINGAGKTSILRSIEFGLSLVADYWSMSRRGSGLPQAGKVVRKRVERVNDRVRLEPVYPVDISLVVQDGERAFDLEVVYQNENATTFTRMPPSNYSRQREIGQTLPVFAVYEAARFVASVSYLDLQANLGPEVRLGAYKNWNRASIPEECKKTLSWIVMKSMERMQIAVESGTAFDKVVGDDLATLNQALRNAFEEFQSIYYDWKSKSILTLWRGVQIKAFEDLSDGERGIILLLPISYAG